MNETVIVAIICGLISGLAGTVASIFWAAYSEAQKRQIEFLQSQLRELYGPLHFFCVQNVELVKLQGRIAEAYKSEFCQNAVGSAEDRQARRVEAFTTIDVENAYGAKVRENNKRMARVIEDKWSFIDEDDREALAELIVHHIRIDTETTEKGMTKITVGDDSRNRQHSHL